MSSFISHNTGSAPDEPYMSKNEILEELGFQKLMLDTLDPNDEDYEPTKALIIQEVEKLQKRLAAIKQKKKAASDVPLQGPFKLAAASSTSKKSLGAPITSSNKAATLGAIIPTSFKTSSSTQPSSNNFSKNDYSSIDPFSDTLPINNTQSHTINNMDPFWYPYSAPAQASMLSLTNPLPHRNVSNNLKRSMDESMGLDIKEESESKSRRTSPGTNVPMPTYKTDSEGFVLLDDSDEEDVVQQQRSVLERAERDRKDHMLAQKIQNGYTSDLPSSRAQPAPAAANAFHKLMGSNLSSQSPAALKNGFTHAQNVSYGRESSSVIPEVVDLDFDDDDDDFQIMSSKPVDSAFRRPSVSVPASRALGQMWQTTDVAGSQRPSAFTPYTPSPYTTQAGMPYQSTQGPYSSQSLAQNNGMGGASQPSVVSGTGATWEDPMEIADRNNLSFGQRADLETYCLDPRRTKAEIENLLANITPEMEIPKEDREGTPEGLRFALYEHQKVALTWLKKQEAGSNKGGILADDMGLGKTISTIALMLSNPSKYARCKTTLIVAPVALLKQWEKEILEKVPNHPHRMSVLVAHGSKAKRYDDMRTYDVVLTSYGTLGSEFKRLDDLLKRKLMHPSMDVHSEVHQKKLPFLGTKSRWYRVVLDEAQNVKNKETKSARAVQALQAEYRFCLTGTPMMNGVHELYSLIKFLRIPPYNDPQAFTNHFGLLKKGTGSEAALARAMRRLQVLLRSVLLRRTKKSTIDGKPLIELPPKTEEVIHAVFDEDQQAFYTALETSSKVAFNKYLKAGTVGKNYSNVLVLLLRLRQAACHPHLDMSLEPAPGLELGSAEMVTLAATIKPDVATRLKESDGFDCPVCYDALVNPILTLECCHHICSECLVKITSIVGALEGDKAKCPSCRADIDNNKCVDWATFQEVHMGKKKDETEVDYSHSDSDSDSESDAISDAGDEDYGADVDSNGDLRDFIVDDDEVDDGFVSRKVLGKKKKKAFAPKRHPFIDDSDTESDNDVADVNDVTDDDDLDAKPKTEAKAEDSEDEKPTKKEENPDDDYLPEFPLEVMERMKKAKEEQPANDFLPETPSEAKARGLYPAKMERITQKVTAEADAKAIRRAARKERSKAKGKSDQAKKENEKAPHKHLNLASLKKEASKNAEGRRKYMRYLRKNFVASAKTDKLMELLLASPRDVKTIVFSQFTTLLDLCEVPISKAGIEIGRYDGSMRADMRHAAVEAFQGGSTQVLLVSLKAGNAGLNLIAGSQVVILDPFWNPYVEMQAVDRAHRIGQQKPVTVHRILVKGTVEDRIIALQERKRKLVDSALDEKSGNAVSKLGIDELKYLFSSDGDARETLIRAPQILGQPDFGGRGGGQYGAGAGSELGAAMGAGLNAGLGALASGSGLGGALGAAGKAVANPYLSGMGGSSVYGGPAPREEPRNPYREAANFLNGSSSEATSPEPDVYNPNYIAFGSNADRYSRNIDGYGGRGYGGYGRYGGRGYD